MLRDWCLLMTAVVVLLATTHCGATATTAPGHTAALGEGGDADNGKAKEPQAGKNSSKQDKPENDISQTPKNGEQKEQPQEEKKQSSKTSAGGGTKPDDTASKAGKTTRSPCNTTTDCASFNGSACVLGPSMKYKMCLCGNLSLPQKPDTCINIKRYVKFPCTNDSQCIANAECVLGLKDDLGHATDTPTTSGCWCKKGFEATPDNAHCLDELGRLKMDMKKLEQGQVFVQERLRALENSGPNNTPSITIAVVMAASLLALHN